MNPLFYFLLAALFFTQMAIAAPHKESPEVVGDQAFYGPDSSAVMNKIQGDLINALDLLQSYQEGASLTPLKLTEKRRNKFEFIRFGRRRR